MWDWDNCTVNRAKVLPDGKVRIVIKAKPIKTVTLWVIFQDNCGICWG